jgi:hypothetical protein
VRKRRRLTLEKITHRKVLVDERIKRLLSQDGQHELHIVFRDGTIVRVDEYGRSVVLIGRTPAKLDGSDDDAV